MYALYAAYGFSHEDNSRLFIFGFGSSMLFGTFIGGYADKHGRKKFAILYCVVYAMSCATKHFNSFFMLSVGRILAGVATSLLYSVFESWVVCEHQQRGFTDAVLGTHLHTKNRIVLNSVASSHTSFLLSNGTMCMYKLRLPCCPCRNR